MIVRTDAVDPSGCDFNNKGSKEGNYLHCRTAASCSSARCVSQVRESTGGGGASERNRWPIARSIKHRSGR